MTAEQPPMVADIIPGMRVVTADGVELGAIKESEPGRFKLNAPFQPDYWLAAALVAGCDGDTLTLSIDREHLAGHRQEDP